MKRRDFDLFSFSVAAIFVIVFGILAGTAAYGIYNESNRINEGTVIDKDYTPAQSSYVHVGESKTPVPRFYAATYRIKLQGEKDGETVTYWRSVTEQEYHALDIGDHYPPARE